MAMAMIRFGIYRGALASAVAALLLANVAQAATWYVRPLDQAPNNLTRQYQPGIQAALAKAEPGDTIELAAGEYFEDIQTLRHATKEKPITIQGVRASVLRGSGKLARIVEINHDHHRLVGFTVDGLVGDPAKKASYRDKLVYVHGREPHRGVAGTLIDSMELRNAGGECLRLRYFVTHSEIRNSHIVGCGVYDFRFSGGGKNGEGIYLGTSSTQWADGKNPTDGPDRSRDNWIHHNVFQTWGNECVDVKEGAERNLIEHNVCERQLDRKSAGFDSRGDNNVFRYNIVQNNQGAAFRFGGHSVAGHAYGVGNHAYGNVIGLNQGGGVKILVAPQGKICGNNFQDPEVKPVVGTQTRDINPARPCPAGLDNDRPALASPISCCGQIAPRLHTHTLRSSIP